MSYSLTFHRAPATHFAAMFLAAAFSLLAVSPASFAAPLVNFPFDEGTGDTTIDSVFGYIGILGDSINLESQPVWTNDTPSGLSQDFALAFNLTESPVRQFVNVDLAASPLDLGINGTNYTLQAWVKLPTRLNTDRMVLYRTAGQGPRVSLSINNNRALHTTVFGNTDFASSVVIPNDNRWHHVAAVMEDNFARMRFYLDGISRQTINRTATGAATASGSPNLLIGMESDARYFRGTLDRVRIDDTNLVAAELDYPAKPGLATFDAHPLDVVADVGATVEFTAQPRGSGNIYWRYRAHLADAGGTSIPDASMAIPRVILTNITLADRGFYSLVVTNDAGESESYSGRLEVRTVPGTLQPLWTIAPGDRPYITGFNSSAALRDLERGMAYNPVTDHLLIGARIDSPTIKGIYIIDAQTGADVGELQETSMITGGTIVLTRVGVADDGAIYACNFGTLSDSNPLKIYRWASETAFAPTLAYQGNPVSGIAGNQQWGKNMIVRGAGINTQILMDTRTSILALFTTVDGENFTPTIIRSDAFDDAAVGMTWGEGDTFWGKSAEEALYQWNLESLNQIAMVQRAKLDFPGGTFSNFSFSEDRRYLAGLVIQPGADALELYDFTNPDGDPVLLDSVPFPTANEHTVFYGNVLISSNRVFALEPNNGVVAFYIHPPPPAAVLRIDRTANQIVLTWSSALTGYVLEATDTLPATIWATVPHEVVGNENRATLPTSRARQFFRLRR